MIGPVGYLRKADQWGNAKKIMLLNSKDLAHIDGETPMEVIQRGGRREERGGRREGPDKAS